MYCIICGNALTPTFEPIYHESTKDQKLICTGYESCDYCARMEQIEQMMCYDSVDPDLVEEYLKWKRSMSDVYTR